MTDPFYRPADQSTRGAQARAAAGRAGRSSEKSQFSTAVWVSVRCVFPCRGEGRFPGLDPRGGTPPRPALAATEAPGIAPKPGPFVRDCPVLTVRPVGIYPASRPVRLWQGSGPASLSPAILAIPTFPAAIRLREFLRGIK